MNENQQAKQLQTQHPLGMSEVCLFALSFPSCKGPRMHRDTESKKPGRGQRRHCHRSPSPPRCRLVQLIFLNQERKETVLQRTLGLQRSSWQEEGSVPFNASSQGPSVHTSAVMEMFRACPFRDESCCSQETR